MFTSPPSPPLLLLSSFLIFTSAAINFQVHSLDVRETSSSSRIEIMTNDETSDAAESPPKSLASESDEREQAIGEVANEPATPKSRIERKCCAQIRKNGFARACWRLVTWTPKRCRWNPDDPPKFSMTLNLIFAFVSTGNLGLPVAFGFDSLVVHNGWNRANYHRPRELHILFDSD